jgi:hypothetical protein
MNPVKTKGIAMTREKLSVMPRRKFLSTGSFWLAGFCLPGLSPLWRSASQARPDLPEELTASEVEKVEKSALAKDLENFFGEGYGCAESLLLVSLRHLRLPEKLVWAAAGFGGGMQHREACGFLTAGIMAIGLAAGELKLERPEAKEWSKQRVNAYWSWWTAQAPLRCAEIRKEGTSSKVCGRLGRLAAAKIEELISPSGSPA